MNDVLNRVVKEAAEHGSAPQHIRVQSVSRRICLAAIGTVLAVAAEHAASQQIYGTPGSPPATMSIPGNQLPPPPPQFGGVIKEEAKDSRPWWRPTVVPPRGAPNVLLIMTDDSGYGVPSTFGGVIPTPALDRIAKNGLRYTQFHSTALCSPTRARRSSPAATITPSGSA